MHSDDTPPPHAIDAPDTATPSPDTSPTVPGPARRMSIEEGMFETAQRLGNDPTYCDRLKHLMF